MEWVFSLRQIPCSEEDLYSAAYTFIDNKRAVPASKTTLRNSSYNLGFIGTYENLERSVTLQHILFIYEFRVTQHLIHSYFQNILEGYTTSLCMKICYWLTKGNLF